VAGAGQDCALADENEITGHLSRKKNKLFFFNSKSCFCQDERESGQTKGVAMTNNQIISKVPPHSEESEKMVLGGILLDPNLMEEISDILSPDDFYIPANKIIYSAIINLYQNNKPFDLPTLQNYLMSKKLIQKIQGGAIYLASLFDSIAAPSSALYHAKIVKKKSTIRQGIHICSGLVSDFFDPGKNDDPDKLIENAQQKLFEISINGQQNQAKLIGDEIEILVDNILDNNNSDIGIFSGFSKLDQIITGGYKPSDLIIVAGRPSMGKTAFALSSALEMSLQGIPSAFFSLEMSQIQLKMRMLASLCKIDLKRIAGKFLSVAEKRKIRESVKLAKKLPIYIDDTPALTTMQIRNRARRMKKIYGIEIIFVDYLQIIKSISRKYDNREREVAEISASLKALAKELDIPVVVLSQLNRKVEERTDKRPKLSDLRESGAIEQDAELILFLYRDEVYNKNTEKKGIAEIIVGKHRNGPLGTIELQYRPEYTLFSETTENSVVI
jgi:replicative DNA helicase